MAHYSRMALPPDGEDTPDLWKLRMAKVMSMDITQKEKNQRNWNLIKALHLVGRKGGSGFLMANLLREFFMEYAQRIVYHSVHSLPTSFNVVESFLHLRRDTWFWEIREETEHLLSLADYFDWYGQHESQLSAMMLSNVLKNARVYSYNFVNNQNADTLRTAESGLVIAGASLIRHKTELSLMVLAGESPPNPPDSEIGTGTDYRPMKHKEELTPASDLSTKDRYLDRYASGFPGYSRVIVLIRLDLDDGRYNVRYVNLDVGNGYHVLSDDVHLLDDFDPISRAGQEKDWRAGLERYKSLLAAATSLIYLPVALTRPDAEKSDTQVATELATMQEEQTFKDAVAILGSNYCKLQRTVTSVRSKAKQDPGPEKLKAPQFKSDGYWKKLPPGQVGQDQYGKSIVGMSWVTRTDAWEAVSVSEFALSKQPEPVDGVDPGVVYKIGLTRRTANDRANDLTRTTATPLPFGVLATFEVGDCASVEAEVHKRLEAFRVSSNREFFRTDLSKVINTIKQVVDDLATDGRGITAP
jgi:hypothetical protein